VLALICGSQLGGVAGLFLAIPLVAISTVLYRHLRLQHQADGLISALFGPSEHLTVAAIAGAKLPPAAPPHLAIGAAPIRVLIVDNDEDARETIAEALRDDNLDVMTAASASEAVATLRRELPLVLISDIGMPGEDGLDLIRRVRALPAGDGRDVRAAALTGYATAEDQERILGAGYQMHLKKPVECEQLRAAIAALLAEPVVAPPAAQAELW
jgi:CheY-like chemotaxis protein